MDKILQVVDAYNSAIHDLKSSVNSHKNGIMSGIMFLIMTISSFFGTISLVVQPVSANLTTDTTNMTDVTNNYVVPTFTTQLGLWLQAPLIYITATVVVLMLLGAVAGIIKGRRRGRG